MSLVSRGGGGEVEAMSLVRGGGHVPGERGEVEAMSLVRGGRGRAPVAALRW